MHQELAHIDRTEDCVNPWILFLLFGAGVCCQGPVFAEPVDNVLSQAIKGESDPAQAGLESGRYEVRKLSGDEPGVAPLQSKPKKKIRKKLASDAPATVIVKPVLDENDDVEPSAQVAAPPGLAEQIQDLFHGGSQLTSARYRNSLHSDDIRQNTVELDVLTGLASESDQSNSAYRTGSATAPFYQVGAHFWVTPLIGLSAAYRTDSGESLSAPGVPSASVNARSEWQTLSLDLRHFAGLSRRANSLQWGLFLTEYKKSIGATETTRIGLRTDTVGLYLNARIPMTRTYAWEFGFQAAPYDNTAELATALNYNSGSQQSAYALAAHGGGEFKLSRQNQIFWALGVNYEQVQYAGTATVANPGASLAPSGVGVQNTWSYFHLGYRWGQ